MPPALTPALALDYVRELSADVRATVLLDAAGELLAGPARLAAGARALLAAGDGAAELEVGTAGGVVCAVRSSSHAAVAVCGRFAIAGVVREDLRAALAALEGRRLDAVAAPIALEPRPGGTAPVPERAAEPTPDDRLRMPERAAESPPDDRLRLPERAAEPLTTDHLQAVAVALISAAERGFDA